MEYLLMLYTQENVDRPEPGSPEFEAYMTDWFRFNQTLIDGGHWIAGGSLQPTATATTLRKPFGGPIAVTDSSAGCDSPGWAAAWPTAVGTRAGCGCEPV